MSERPEFVWSQCIAHVLRWEGGISRDPRDPGGVTKYGISQRAYPTIDIEALTRDQATAIYRRDYWDASGVIELPELIVPQIFDSCVNQGVVAAVRMLQSACGVNEDGILGDGTISAARKESTNSAFARWLHAIRLDRYSRTANARTYFRGWCCRATAAYELGLELAGMARYAPAARLSRD